MKNTLLALAFLSVFAANAQTASTTSESLNVSVASAPAKHVSSDNIRPEHFLPVLGNFKTGNSSQQISITVDPANIGIIWIEGLQQGRFKALLKQSPAVYKIPAQTTESGKRIAEGTLVYDKQTAELKIILGIPFNDASPVAAFNTDGKSKSKSIYLTALKTEASTISQ
jgi:hypothetical protein